MHRRCTLRLPAGRGTLVAVDEGEIASAGRPRVPSAPPWTRRSYRPAANWIVSEPVGVNPRGAYRSCGIARLPASEPFRPVNMKTRKGCTGGLLSSEPDLADAQSYLARSLAMLDREDEAIPFFRRAVELEPERFQDQRALGNRLAAKGEYDEAMEHFRQAIEYNPEELIARVNLGVVLTSQGHPEEAIPLFDEALKIVPDGANPPSERSRTSGVGANRGSKGVDL